MNNFIRLIFVLLFTYSFQTAFGKDQTIVNKIHSQLPSISPFEKYCVLNYQPGKELQECLVSQPRTELFKLEQANRGRMKIDILQQLAADNASEDDDIDPWLKFCANQPDWWCLEYCLNGWVCPY